MPPHQRDAGFAQLVHPETFETVPVRLVVDDDGLWVRYRGAGGTVEDEDDPRGAIYVGWRSLEGLSADEIDLKPEGSGMQVLEIVARDGMLTVLMPAPEVSELLAEIGEQSTRWGRARQAVDGHGADAGPEPSRGSLAFTVGVGHRVRRVAGAVLRGIVAVPLAVTTAMAALVRGAWRGVAGAFAALAVVSWRAAQPLRHALTGSRAMVAVATHGQQLETRHDLARREGYDGGRLAGVSLTLGAVLWARRKGVAVSLSSVLVVTGASAAVLTTGSAAARDPRPAATAGTSGNEGVGHFLNGLGRHHVVLAPATAPPAPAPPSLASAPPLQPHEDFGFAPYWTLPQSSTFDVQGLTTIAYFSIDVNPDGTLDKSGSGWQGLQSQALADLVTRAHQSGVRVVLTVNQFDQGALDTLTSSKTAPATLSAALISAIQSKNLDGVNLDFEGEGSGDQAGLTNLVTQVSNALHGVDPHWQVTMDTYASSAGDPNGFYDIPALAPHVDAFFVMAYDLNLESPYNPASPLTSGMFSNLTMAEQYSSAVNPAKVIMGLPFYGYDWPTNNGTMTAAATGGATAITYAQAISDNNPQYWDPITNTAWTSFRIGTQWHEEFYEDATSLYEAAQVAQWFHLAGVGIWALGMDVPNSGLIAALDGFAPAVQLGPAGPAPTSTTSSTTTTTKPPRFSPNAGTTSTSTSTTTTTPSTTTTTAPPYTYSGTWDAQKVALTLVTAAPAGTASPVGTITGFTTDNPAYQCLASESSLQVVSYAGDPGVDAVVTTKPTDCVNAIFTFTVPPTTGGSGTGTDGNSGAPGSGSTIATTG